MFVSHIFSVCLAYTFYYYTLIIGYPPPARQSMDGTTIDLGGGQSDHELTTMHRLTAFSDISAVGSILDKVDELQETVDLDIIDRLVDENLLLQQSITCYRQQWTRTLKLLREAFEAAVLLEDILLKCDQAEKAAEVEWLSSRPFEVGGHLDSKS
jgi:hypothetical protein